MWCMFNDQKMDNKLLCPYLSSALFIRLLTSLCAYPSPLVPLSVHRVSCPRLRFCRASLMPFLALIHSSCVASFIHVACFKVFLVHACLHAPTHSAASVHTSVTALPNCSTTVRRRHTALQSRLSASCCVRYSSHDYIWQSTHSCNHRWESLKACSAVLSNVTTLESQVPCMRRHIP